jgi:hypothetical protein
MFLNFGEMTDDELRDVHAMTLSQAATKLEMLAGIVITAVRHQTNREIERRRVRDQTDRQIEQHRRDRRNPDPDNHRLADAAARQTAGTPTKEVQHGRQGEKSPSP